MTHRSDDGIETETLVITTEDGVALTGNRLHAFEGRLMRSLRTPLYILFGLMFIMFVLLAGVSIFLNSLDDTVHNTDRILTAAVSPEAKAQQAKQQAKVVQDLLEQVDCRDQKNLQKVIDGLIAAGITQLKDVSPLIDENCK